MGKYLSIFRQVQDDVYNKDLQSAYLKLQTLLNCVNSDLKSTTNKKDKEVFASTIKRLLPALDDLKNNRLTDVSIAVLKLDVNILYPKKVDTIEEVINEEPKEKEKIEEDSTDEVKEDEEVVEVEETSKPQFQKERNILTPLTFDDYIGQNKAKETLKIAIQAAKKEHRALNHLLICSSYGIGKTTLANIIANEMGLPFIEVNASSLKDTKGLLKFFSTIKESCIIFIDEIHNLSNDNQTVLLSILTQYRFSLIDSKGSSKNIELPSFTLIGASTQSGELLKPFINRFTILELSDYSEEEKNTIVKSKLEKLNFTYTEEAAKDIASRSRGIPRNMETFIKGIKDLCLSLDINHIDIDITHKYFNMYDIDEIGLYARDREILKVLSEQDKPIGLVTMESKLGIQKEDIEYRYEPYLLKIKFIEKTEKGRVITPLGLEYIKKSEQNQ